MLKKFSFIVLTLGMVVSFSGCNFPGQAGQPIKGTQELAEGGPSSTPTVYELAPTLPAGTKVPTVVPVTLTPTQATALAPTALPAPTQIVPATLDPAATGTAVAPAGPIITMNPAVGEPGDVVVIDGSGFPANAHVTLHWGAVGGPHGPVYWELDADASGVFSVGLIVPPASQWPGGSAKERDLLQLQARSEAMDDTYVFANFTYVKRFASETSLVLNYASATYGYKIDVPNGWKWDDSDKANVRFSAPSGNAKGFIRTVNTTDVDAAIQTVMAAEASGQTYTSTAGALGANQGTQVTVANGLIVWFVPIGGRICAVSFTDNNGQFFMIIASSFRQG